MKRQIAAAGGNLREPRALNEGNCQVAQGSHHLWGLTRADTGAIFPEGDISDVVETVLTAPMASDEFEQAEWAGLVRGKTRDQLDDLLARLTLGGDGAGELADLGNRGPGGG